MTEPDRVYRSEDGAVEVRIVAGRGRLLLGFVLGLLAAPGFWAIVLHLFEVMSRRG